MIWRVCLWTLTLLTLTQPQQHTAHATFIQHPVIDLEQLQQIGIAGPYRGISLYTDTRQLTELPHSTASIVSFSNQTFELLASTSTHGSIYATCTMAKDNGYDLYVGGEFMQLGSLNASNIAVIDLSTGTVSALANGLDGAVYTLYCDNKSRTVYVGGSFLAPVADAPQYAESLAYFGGGTAAWLNNTWHGLPWKGFNRPVTTITKHENTGIVYFGGQFDTSADGQMYYAPASQPVSLASPAKITATNSGTENNDPQNAVCPETLDQTPWLVLDDMKGTWEASFPYSVTPSLIRLGNTHLDGRGTKNFSVISIPNNVPFNLTYIDPVTKKLTTCSTDCSLSDDVSIEYQDFQVGDSTLSSGIRIEISSWYGQGAGLSAVEIFMSEIFVYAVDSLNGKACVSSMDYTQRSHVKTTGSWRSGLFDNSYVYTLATTMSQSQMASSKAAVDFIPYLPEAGTYEVYLYAPACGNSCSGRTQVDVTTYALEGGPSTMKTVDLNSKNDNTFLVYSGEISATTVDFQPYVTVKVAHNATATSNNVTIDLQAVQFIKQASNTTLTSMLEFTPDNAQIKTNATLSGSYGPLQDNIPYGSEVKALDATDGNVYIGGKFSSPAGSNATYQNIVRYDFATKKLVGLNNAGVNGPVMSFLRDDSHLYVGGSFSGLANGKSDGMNNIARYSIGQDTWDALSGGVNGPVEAMHFSADSKFIIASGNHTGAFNDPKVTTTFNTTSGNAWWSVSNHTWVHDKEYLSGAVYGVFHMDNNSLPSTVYAGNLKAAQTYQSRGFSFLDQHDALSSLPVYPDGSKLLSITAGAYWSDTKHGNTTTMILGGEFQLEDNIENVALYANDSWSGIGAQWNGPISTMAVNGGYLYIGGSFSATNTSGIAIYDLVNKTFVPVPELHTADKSPAQVNAIHYHPQENVMLIAGNFSTAGSLSCAAVCTLNPTNHQWNNLGDKGISGDALDFALTETKLLVAGNLELDGSTIPLAQYDYDTKGWSPVTTDMTDSGLPGNTTAVSYDSGTQKAFISGLKDNNAYLRVWDGQGFVTPDDELGSGSFIRQVTVLPLKESGQSDLFGNDKTVLLAAGFLNLGGYGNLSSALYNGSAWIPYLSVSSDNGATNTLSNVFFKSYDVDLTRPDYLPAPIVVLVSVAGALGIVFLIVLCGLCILYAKRRKEAKVNPAGNPASYYGKPPQRPESVLAMINNAGAAGLMYDPKKGISDDTTIAGGGEMYSIGKDKVPEMTETNNGLKGGTGAMGGFTTGVAAATAATATAAGAAAAAATRDERPHETLSNLGAQSRSADNVTRDMSNNAPYIAPSSAGGLAGAAVTASALSGNRQSYNPFRASAVGLAVSNDWSDAAKANNSNSNYASRTITNGGQDSMYLGNLAPEPVAASSNVRWTNAPTAEATSATIIPDPLSTLAPSPVPSQVPSAAPSSTLTGEGAGAVRWTNVPSGGDNMATATVGPVSMMSTSPVPSATTPDESNPAAVRWTNVPALDGPTTATVGPVSMYSTSSMLVTNDGQPASSSNVRWTNTEDASGAIGAAMVMAPVIGRENNNDHTRSIAGEHEASNVRWTNYTTHEDQGVAMLRPVTAVSMYSDASFGPTPEFGGVSNNNDLFATSSTRPSMTDFSSDPDIVRWTTAPNVDSAKATAIITKDNTSSSLAMPASGTMATGVAATAAAAAVATTTTSASHQSRDMLRPSSESSMDHPRSIPRQYESGLDLASLTVSDVSENESNDKYSGVVTNERPLSHVEANNSSNDPPYPSYNTKDMLSETAALASSSSAAVAAASASAMHSSPSQPQSTAAVAQHASSQPYSEAMMPSTTYQPALTAMQPSSSQQPEPAKSVTTDEEKEDGGKRDIESSLFKTSSFRWSETPSLPPIDTNLVFSAPSHPMSSPLGTPDDPSVRWKETHAASPIERGHAPQIIGASAATVTVTQAHRQVNDDDDDDDDDTENSSNDGDGRDDDDMASQGRKNSLGAAAALDGRAASKRMVQDYFSSRDPALAGTKEAPNGKQYHKDFVAAMEAAALNNRDDLPSTEDHPHLYYAKFDFNAREHGELGFDKGDPIIVVDRSDDIWWMGYKDNGEHGPMQGVFPSNYVERASPPS